MKKVQFEHFYTYSELEEFLTSAAQAYPEYMKLEIIAETAEDRRIFLVTLADFSLGDKAEERGAYYVQSGIHANEGAGTTAALHLIETVLQSEDKKELLNKNVFYVIPRVNPDGCEYSITKCATVRSKMMKKPPMANAVIPADLNNDGMILSMRIENPMGVYKEHPEIPGLMVERRPGDIDGKFYDMYTEGYVENYDGGKLCFGMRNRDLNRSLPSYWNPAMETASDYPCQDVESRAIADFLVSHPNIYAGIDYHCGSNGILRPLTAPDSELALSDLKIMNRVGNVGSEITGLPLIHEYEYRVAGEPYAKPYGCSNNFSYYVLGISHYVIELGNGYNGIGLTTHEILQGLGDDGGGEWTPRIVRRHRELGSEIMVPWQEFDHPQLGKVEIGGLKDGQAYYMYPKDMEQLIPKTTNFLLRHAQMGPVLMLGNIEKLDLGGGNYRIRAAVMNVGEFGTKVMPGATGYNAQRNVNVSIEGAEVLSRPGLYTITDLAPMESHLLEWFIKGEAGKTVTITAQHPKAKAAVAKIEL